MEHGIPEALRPRLELDLSGPDGNVFAVIAAVRNAIRQLARLDVVAKEKEAEFLARMPKIGETGVTYQDVLAICREYVNLIDTSDEEEEEITDPVVEELPGGGKVYQEE